MSDSAPPPPPPGGSYGEPPQYGGGSPQTSTMAVVSLITGILGIPCCGWLVLSIVAVVTGYLAKKEIAGSGGAKTGGGLAQAGFILGIVGVVLGLVLLILQVSGAVNYNWDTSFGS